MFCLYKECLIFSSLIKALVNDLQGDFLHASLVFLDLHELFNGLADVEYSDVVGEVFL